MKTAKMYQTFVYINGESLFSVNKNKNKNKLNKAKKTK